MAHGLGGAATVDSIRTLIELTADSDAEVRNWATFGLGSLCTEDSPEIRSALRNRLNDGFEDARTEAIWGLPHRKDREGLELLLDRLGSDHWPGDEMNAAEILDLDGDPPVESLRAGLQRLLDRIAVAGTIEPIVSE